MAARDGLDVECEGAFDPVETAPLPLTGMTAELRPHRIEGDVASCVEQVLFGLDEP